MRSYIRSMASTLLLLVVFAHGQTSTLLSAWQDTDPGFRALAITSSNGNFWVAGVGGAIASSPDGAHWQIKRPKVSGQGTLVGIEFATKDFGYAYGTGGTLLTTEDGGNTWIPRNVISESILLASFSDSSHGLFRTRESVYLLDGGDTPQIISQPAETMKRFPYTPFLVALTPDKVAILLSEGPYSESGFLSTTDAGKTWNFYDPPSTGVASFLRVDGKYWATGHEVVGKDKPGGGGSVPLAMSSDDALQWTHATSDIHPCHWENCSICTTDGCLASANLLANFFKQSTEYFLIPKGDLGSKWAAVQGRICTIHQRVSCAVLGKATDLELAPPLPKPLEQSIPPLGTQTPPGSTLRCMACALEPVYIDNKVQGRFTVHVALQIGTDGTVESVVIQNAPNDPLRQKLQAQIESWLFEPPQRDGKPIRVATQSDIPINVVRPR
jgi:hypothetical protein